MTWINNVNEIEMDKSSFDYKRFIETKSCIFNYIHNILWDVINH